MVKCKDCVYYVAILKSAADETVSYDSGECRRLPTRRDAPIVVESHGWCGEYRNRGNYAFVFGMFEEGEVK